MSEQILQKIGLTKNESKVYLTLLKIGESKSGKILNESGLNSGKIYEILDSLQKKGLISSVIKSKVKYFCPSDPKRILNYLEEKKKEIDNWEEEYRNILPKILSEISSFKDEPKIEVFVGFEGMKTAYYKEFEYYPNNKILYVIGIIGREKYRPGNYYNFFVNNIYPKRRKRGVKCKKIYSEDAKEGFDKIAERDSEVKFVNYTSPVTINVIGKLSIIGINVKNRVTVVIESREVAESFIKYFNLLWKQAKP